MCAAVACFACLDASAKLLVGRGYAAEQVVFVRYAANLALLLAFVNPLTVPGVFRSARPGLQIARGVMIVVSSGTNFFALRYLQLAETVSIMFAAPFITALLAGLVLKQWLGPWHWAAIGLGFVGVLIVTRPGLGGLHWAAWLMVVGACAYAIYNLLTRAVAAHDSAATTITLGSLYGTLFSAPFALAPAAMRAPESMTDAALMLGTGAFGLVGHWLLVLAHRRASAQSLAPFVYTQLVWMILLGWTVFGDVPAPSTLLGAAVVVASGLWFLALERRRPS
jgi:drug/metabolite transporter (DMT)-like permease